LTHGKLHTISPATIKILQSLETPVLVNFYVSSLDKMPTGMKSLEQDVIDKLNELRINSNGNLQYKIFHMEAANIADASKASTEKSLEEQLQSKGILPFQVQAIDSDEVAIRLIYSSISLSYKEKPEEIIPHIMPVNLYDLEYTIASKIYRMTLRDVPRIALVAPYTESAIDPQLQALIAQLGGQVPGGVRNDPYEVLQRSLEYEGYEVDRIFISEAEPIDEDTDSLVLIEPKKLNERQRYEINRFLVGGGSVFMAVQNYSYRYVPRQGEITIESIDNKTNINELLSEWGLEVDSDVLVDNQHQTISLSGAAQLGPFQMSVPVKIPIQIFVTQSGMNSDISITSQLSNLLYLWGTAIKLDQEKIKAQPLTVTTLFESSTASWTVPFRLGVLKRVELVRKIGTPMGPFPFAVMVEGQFRDVFEGKTRPKWPKPDVAGDLISQDTDLIEELPKPLMPQPGKLILTGAATMFQQQGIRSGGHLNFFMNVVDALTLGEELVTIRSKQPINRGVGRVPAASKAAWRGFVTILVPVIVSVIGITRYVLRKKSKQKYLDSLVRK